MKTKNTSQGLAVFVVNTGSSSVKYERFLMRGPDDYEVTHEGKITRVKMPEDTGESLELFSIDVGESLAFLDGADEPESVAGGLTHEESIEYILENSIKDAPIHVVGNRVVHGREISRSCVIDEAVENVIEEAEAMAPLHNPYALKAIRAIRSAMPNVIQVAVFDTSPYANMPLENTVCPIPYSYFEEHGIRRFGFHGTSHRYVAGQAAQYLGRPLEEAGMVTCHMGNGTSITAWREGKAVNTSMSFTPTAGTIMGSRCGDIDPGIVLYLIEALGHTPEQVKHMLNKESGLLGISGVSNDVQELQEAITTGNDPDGMADLALDLYAKSVRKYIIQYVYEELDGNVDAIVFTAGIGENAEDVRERRIIQRLPSHLRAGFEHTSRIMNDLPSSPGATSKGRFMVIHTDEELMIAQDALRVHTEYQNGL
ncbi:acetate/propionate family kinase [Candidatus Poribacteria bacterium]